MSVIFTVPRIAGAVISAGVNSGIARAAALRPYVGSLAAISTVSAMMAIPKAALQNVLYPPAKSLPTSSENVADLWVKEFNPPSFIRARLSALTSRISGAVTTPLSWAKTATKPVVQIAKTSWWMTKFSYHTTSLAWKHKEILIGCAAFWALSKLYTHAKKTAKAWAADGQSANAPNPQLSELKNEVTQLTMQNKCLQLMLQRENGGNHINVHFNGTAADTKQTAG